MFCFDGASIEIVAGWRSPQKSAQPWIATHLDLLVFLGKFPAQLLQFILHGDGLVQFRFAFVLVLLQLIGSFFTLGIVAIQLLHVGEKFGVFLVDGLESGHRGLDVAEQLVQIPRSLLDFTLCRRKSSVR